MDDTYLSPKEAGEILGCTDRTIYNHINKKSDLGLLFHRGVKIRIKKKDLMDWVRSR